MYCNTCGEQNPKNSNYCQFCGEIIALNQTQQNRKFSDAYPLKKFTILMVFTYGIYFLYWFEHNWQLIKRERNSNINPFWRTVGLFIPLLNFYLVYLQFKEIKRLAVEVGIEDTFSPFWSSVGYILLNLLSVGFLSPFVVNNIQSTFNKYWNIRQPHRSIRKSFSIKETLALFLFACIYVLVFLVYLSTPQNSKISSTSEPIETQDVSVLPQYNQSEIASSVVNIFCPKGSNFSEGSGGSGTLITNEGIVLTNAHVIPQQNGNVNVNSKGCLVILPNSTSGQPEEVYWADPLVVPDISEKYDLAYLSIKQAYFNEETQEYQGTYPRTFPAFDDSARCVNDSVKLGEKITIFGYPSLSGGISLTVTDGLVSSFPGDGLIITSAKISQGNSGGLAVDSRGCMIGVPSMVNSDETESLGVIISTNLIDEFSNEVLKYFGK